MIEYEGLKMLDVHDIAKVFSISTQAVRKLFREQKISSRKLGNKWYCTEAEFEAYLTGQKQAQQVTQEQVS